MTSFLDRLKAKMSGNNGFAQASMFQPEKKIEKTRQPIAANRWDQRVWREARPIKSIDDMISDLSIGDQHRGGERSGFEVAPELVEGLFYSLYKAAPRLEDKRNIEREAYPARKILEEMLANPKLQELQDITANDPVMSAMAVDAMSEAVKQIIVRLPPPPPPPQPKQKRVKVPKQEKGDGEPQEGDGQPGPLQGNGDGEGEGEGQGTPTEQDAPEGDGTENDEELTGEGDGEPEDEDEEEDDGEADWQSAYDDLLDDVDMERLANKALDAAHKDASELEDLRKGIGLDDGDWQSMSPEQRMKMADQLRTPEMKELADVIGRMKRFALGIKATRVNDVPHEAYDVETGNDIRRLLRAEFALLATPETSFEFYRKYADKELLQYKMRGHEEVGKGPIVIAIDKSGSMNGQPFRWAMGVAEALRRFAADEDRDYYAMFFGANNDRHRFNFPSGKAPWEKVMAFLSCVANGGTQFDGVLTEALDKAMNAFDGAGKGKADIVFITDGQAHLTDEWIANFNKERERVGVRVYSVYIGGAYDMSYHQGPIGLLNQISDVVIPVKDLNPESAKQIFQSV